MHRRAASSMRAVTHPIETGAPRKWLTLLAMTGSLCMILLDVTVVGVSLPAIQADLHLSDVQTQWVVNAYILAMASTVALGGRAADALGKVPSFVIGVIAFAGASVPPRFPWLGGRRQADELRSSVLNFKLPALEFRGAVEVGNPSVAQGVW